MSLTLLGYNTRGLLRACARTRVYELERRDDGRRVIAKVFPAEGSEAQVRQELALLESLDIRGVVKPLGLERVEDNLVLLLERVDGRDLRSLTRGRPMAVADFLPVAIQLTEILAQVHERGIIHRDVKP
ncbi:MAG: protein kinase, partial [Myxococcales bacterium]|nr:protein kinase [Myxococcales bacterium]